MLAPIHPSIHPSVRSFAVSRLPLGSPRELLGSMGKHSGSRSEFPLSNSLSVFELQKSVGVLWTLRELLVSPSGQFVKGWIDEIQ